MTIPDLNQNSIPSCTQCIPLLQQDHLVGVKSLNTRDNIASRLSAERNKGISFPTPVTQTAHVGLDGRAQRVDCHGNRGQDSDLQGRSGLWPKVEPPNII
jgi:hypothetical protein